MASNNGFGAETTAEEVASFFRDQIVGKTSELYMFIHSS